MIVNVLYFMLSPNCRCFHHQLFFNWPICCFMSHASCVFAVCYAVMMRSWNWSRFLLWSFVFVVRHYSCLVMILLFFCCCLRVYCGVFSMAISYHSSCYFWLFLATKSNTNVCHTWDQNTILQSKKFLLWWCWTNAFIEFFAFLFWVYRNIVITVVLNVNLVMVGSIIRNKTPFFTGIAYVWM